MHSLLLVCCLALSVWFMSCGKEAPPVADLIDQTVAAHGGDHYQQTRVSFRLRDKFYNARISGSSFSYARSFNDPADGSAISDILTPQGMVRYRNVKQIRVADSMAVKYSESINSVIYFALLPKPLKDPAVQASYLDEREIDGKPYHAIQVTFAEEGGGTDFEDVYVYWINQETNRIDYLAYSFKVNGGGLRFRKAYNRQEVGGITFQDYVNYKADPNEWEVQNLDEAFEDDKLEELSRIQLTEIQVKPLERQ